MVKDLFKLDGKFFITGVAGLLGREHAEAIACFGGTPVLLDSSSYLNGVIVPVEGGRSTW